MQKSNLVLIGMPGVGKSTVGVVLAKHLGLNFIDTDLLLQSQAQKRLQEIINLQGLRAFNLIEEGVLLGLNATYSVIATGGSVVYSEAGMAALSEQGRLIYLKISLPLLQQRLKDTGMRGVVIKQGQSFADLYHSRIPLYEKYAEVTIACDNLSVSQVASKIEEIYS